MKIILNSIFTLMLVALVSINISAQEKDSSSDKKKTKVETSKFEVKGVCNMCKDRIENAALIKGVKWVEWDKATDTITVIYRKDKLDLIKVHNSIAEAGHTTDKVKCDLEAYNKLPACCAYMGDVKKH